MSSVAIISVPNIFVKIMSPIFYRGFYRGFSDYFHNIGNILFWNRACGFNAYHCVLAVFHTHARQGAQDRAQDRGRFCVFIKSLVFVMIFKGENDAKTSSQKK